jgi:hypothetical protein
MTDNEQILKDGILEALELLKEYGKAVLIQQGHNATGDGINSLNTEIDTLGNQFLGSVTGRKYLLAQDTGVKAERYKNKYPIEAILKWIEKKGFADGIVSKGGKKFKDVRSHQLSVAFAIRYTHRITGIHSTNNQRDLSKQGWIGQTIDVKKQEVFDIISRSGYKYFDSMIKSMVDENLRNK